MALQPNLQIAAGHGNTGGLTAIESVLTLTSTARGIVRSVGNYSEGVKTVKPDGTLFHSGFPTTTWVFNVMSYVQYVQLQTTYCGGSGGFSGLVTIKTNAHDPATYANYNATLILPEPGELQVSGSRHYFRDVAIRFVNMVAL